MTLHSIRIGLVTIALGMAGQALLASTAQAEDYSFKASNSTETTITKILVSQNNKDWSFFDVGAGIKPGTTVDLIWDQSTNGQACEQWVKAAFEDGSESEAAQFDFCESDLELDF